MPKYVRLIRDSGRKAPNQTGWSRWAPSSIREYRGATGSVGWNRRGTGPVWGKAELPAQVVTIKIQPEALDELVSNDLET